MVGRDSWRSLLQLLLKAESCQSQLRLHGAFFCLIFNFSKAGEFHSSICSGVDQAPHDCFFL